MYRLQRRVRFAINPAGQSAAPGTNGYAGNPPLRGLGLHSELLVECASTLDPRSQYVINIKDIDRAFRQRVLPGLSDRAREPGADPISLLPMILTGLRDALPASLTLVRWHLSPYLSVEMAVTDASTVLLRQRFDFCAAHRLHNPALSAEENRAVFGKCNNPSGHGHNYQFEPCVAVPLGATGAKSLTLDTLERLAEDAIIERFDHKNLNTDTAEFRDGSGVLPTVEQISRVCFELLDQAIRAGGYAGALRSVTVWESDRTSSTYPA